MVYGKWMAAAVAAGWMGVAVAQGAGAGAGAGAGGAGVGAGKDTSSSAGSRTPEGADMKAGTGTGPRDSSATNTPASDRANMGSDQSASGTGAGGTSASGSATSGSSGSGSMSPATTGSGGASDTASMAQGATSDMTTTLAKMHAGNEAEIQAGQFMQDRAKNSKVKDFAKKMVKDHTALDKDGQQFAQKHSLDLTSAPDYQAKKTEHQSMLDQMKSMQGPELDKHYMQMMVEDHQKDVSEVKQAAQQAKTSGGDKEYAKMLDKADKKMSEHLKDAQKISRDLGSRQARTPANQ